MLAALLRSDADFDAFCLDYCPEAYWRFSHGMDRLSKTSLLLELVDATLLLDHLRLHFQSKTDAQAIIANHLAMRETEEAQRAWALAQELSQLRLQRAQLRLRGQDTADLDAKIIAVKRAQRQAPELHEGEVLKERYRLLVLAGSGGFARVWQAFDDHAGSLVAVKVLHRAPGDESRRLERFMRGAQQMRALNHPHIARVLDEPGEYEGFHFFVMEYLSGGDLHAAIRGGKLDRVAALRAILQVGDALKYAHARGLIHRDIKPQNILLDADGAARLTDFDLVWAPDTTGGTRTGAMGTYLYAAPEEMEDAGRVDQRADIYSLAMSTLFVLHGKRLSPRVLGSRPQFIANLDCSKETKALLLRATSLDRNERPATIEAFCRELSDSLLGAPETGAQGSSSTPDLESLEVSPRPSSQPRADASTVDPSQNLIPLRVGQLVGNFRIVSKIGHGGMGAVYAAVHRQIGRRAAIKVLHGSLSRASDYTARFLNEARAVNILHHPNLVEIFDFGQLPDGTLYIIMEFLEGESLRDKLRRVKKLSEPVAVELALQMGRALESAHLKGIVHRDLKPENVMLVADAGRREEEQVKILDFGIAKFSTQAQIQKELPHDPDGDFRTAAGTTMGTPRYMAPEQYGDASQVDGKADVFALGVILYEMVSGTVPFAKISLSAFHEAPKSISEVTTGVSPQLAATIHRMLTPNAFERPSMREALEALQPPPSSRIAKKPVLHRGTAPRWNWFAWAFVVMAAGSFGVASYKGYLRTPPKAERTEQLADLSIDIAGPRARALGVLYMGLRSPDASLRAQAVRALGQSRDIAQWSSIASLLKDRDPVVQAEAAEALGRLGASDASNSLLTVLDEPLLPGVKVTVAGALARLLNPRGDALLRTFLVDADDRIRLRAALLLLETGDIKASEHLRTAIANGNIPDETIILILGRLAQIGDSRARQQLSASLAGDGFTRRRIAAAGQLIKVGDERAREFLMKAAQEVGPQQLSAALLLATLGDTVSFDLFKATALDARQQVEAREVAMNGLGACRQRQGAVLLASIFDEATARPALRQTAAGAILEIAGGDPTQIAKQSLSWAQAALGQDDWLVRQVATAVLADLDDAQAVPLLTRTLADPRREVRQGGALALGQKPSRDSLNALRQTLLDAEPEVRETGLRAMIKVLAALPANRRMTDAETYAHILKLVDVGSINEQILAAATLLWLGDTTRINALRNGLATDNIESRKLLVESLPGDESLLKEALHDKDSSVRMLAARRLGTAGQREAVPLLREALSIGGVEGLQAYSLLRKLGESVNPPAGYANLLGTDMATSLAVLDIAAELAFRDALALLNRARFDWVPAVRRRVAEVAALLYRQSPEPALLSLLYGLEGDSDITVRTRAAARLGDLMRPVLAPRDQPAPDMRSSVVDTGAMPALAPDTRPGALRIIGEQRVRFQLDQQAVQTLEQESAVLQAAPGHHTVSYVGGSLDVMVTAGQTAVAQVPTSYAEQLLSDAEESLQKRKSTQAQQLVDRARMLAGRGRGPRRVQGEFLVLQARIFEMQGRWLDAMTEVQALLKLPETQRTAAQTQAGQALQSRLGGRLGRMRVYKQQDGRCLMREHWVRPGEHRVETPEGEVRTVRIREGATVDVKLCNSP